MTIIQQLEEQISETKNPFKAKSLKEKLSWAKAAEAGQFITREHLVEFRSVIIAKINRSLFFGASKDAVVTVMNQLLAEKMIYRTKAGIKGIVLRKVLELCRTYSLDQLIAREGSSVLSSGRERSEGSTYDRMNSFYMNIKLA